MRVILFVHYSFCSKFYLHPWCICQLRDGSSHQGTVTSMEPNEGTFLLHSESAKVIYFNLMCSNLTQAVLISNDMKWEYVFQIQPGILGGANPSFSHFFMSSTEGKNKACTCCWCSWSFSSSTQTRRVLASSSWHRVCCWCFGILTQLECSYRVITNFNT